MRVNHLLKALLLGHIWLIIANGQASQPPPSSLQLMMKVIGKEYCAGDAELDRLSLRVRLVYTNTGKQKLILYKNSSLVSRIMISRNMTEAMARRFEVDSSLTQLTSASSKCYRGASPNNCFIILSPSASYEVETVISLFVVRDDVREITGAVESGDHVLQVEVITWHESDKKAKNLRARWLRYGTLWYEPVTSVPLPFTVERQHKVTDCQ